jgi:putative spermidine/putrescine transport system ATP-binding protein
MRPRTGFVASFVGSANVVSGELAERITGSRRPFAIRPELIEIRPAEGPLPEGLLVAPGTLEDVLYHGASSRCHVRVDADTLLAVARAESAGAEPLPGAGSRVRLTWRPADVVTLEG